MATTEVLLVKPVEGLGGEGDQVKVRAGYARNFLLPRKIAVTLSAANKKHVESLKKRRAEREQHELSGAQEVAKKLEKTSLAFAVKTGEGGRMFGAITANDIHDKLAASGLELDKKKIHLFTPVKTLGKHEVKIKLHPDVTVDLPFDVVSENPIETAPAAEEKPAGEKTEKRADRRPRKTKDDAAETKE
jgi:large subunit ribosomal protein L9